MKLIKNGEVYAPKYLGKKDLLICNEKIEYIADQITEVPEYCEVISSDIGPVCAGRCSRW